jgi:hypothetical protein
MAIFFQDDWLKYPDAVIDYKTQNKSALELAAKLRLMGVKNNAFFLALHNPSLQGVDPFDPNLTQQQMIDIGIEIKVNPWYYFREIGRVPALSGNTVGFVELNRANIALWWCFFLHIVVFLTQPRQTGKSFSADHLANYLMNFRCTNTQINLLTKDEKLRGENIKRLKAIYDELPSYLNFKTREDANNTEEITIKRLNNTYKTHLPQAAPKNADKVGRGLTTPILFVDESPFQVNIDVALFAAAGAMGAAIDAAKLNDEPYGIAFTTTAGRKNEKEGAYIFGMIEKSAPFTEAFYDAKDAQDLERMVKANGRGNFRTYICFSHKQLGKSDEWLRERITSVDATAEQINRDFFNIWTSGTSSNPIPIDILEKIEKSERDALHFEIDKTGYMLRWYIPDNKINEFMASNDVVAGIDTSDAIGKDNIAVVFTSVRTGATIAVGVFNETNLITFAMYLVDMLVRWKRLTYVIERKSSGITIIDYLLLFLPTKKIDPFKRIFNWVVNDPLEHAERAQEMSQSLAMRSEEVYTRSKRYFGFATSSVGQTSRTLLYSSTLMNAVKRNCNTIFDRNLSGQIRGLVIRNNRVDHAPDEHDDLVIAWLLTNWFLTQAKNLSHYGIDPTQILSASTAPATPKTSEEQLSNFLQMQIRQRINTLFDLMSNEPDAYLMLRYESELRELDRQLILQEGENFSLDVFLNALKEKRKKGNLSMAAPVKDYSYARQLGYSDGVAKPSRLPAGTIVM